MGRHLVSKLHYQPFFDLDEELPTPKLILSCSDKYTITAHISDSTKIIIIHAVTCSMDGALVSIGIVSLLFKIRTILQIV